jgi:hypothetical protein
MVRTGLVLSSSSSKNDTSSATLPSVDYSKDAVNDDDNNDSLPILAIDHDEIGCNIPQPCDDVGFPRLTWATLSMRHSTYCTNAVSMPSYESWKYYHRSHVTPNDWERDFQYNEVKYPWTSKLHKAVWRGSTTYEGHQYHNSELGETPRGRLVKASMTNPELIDAAFHKIIQKFKSRRIVLTNEFSVSGRMPPSDMMRYRGTYHTSHNQSSIHAAYIMFTSHSS